MCAFLLEVIQKASVVTDEQTTGHNEFWQGRQAAFDQCPRAIGNTFAALQVVFDEFVLFEALKFIKGAQVWIAVAKIDDQANGNLVVLQVINV